jgi:hypothetical protein
MASGGEDRIADGRRQRRQSGLAQSGRRKFRLDEMRLGLRRMSHAQDRIIALNLSLGPLILMTGPTSAATVTLCTVTRLFASTLTSATSAK